jgi:pimeloyl-ACP methyl ester carboxylesterase
MLFGGLRSQPWRLSPAAAAGDLHDFGYSPGFQSTLSSTVATRAPMSLREIQVPVRVAYGMLDVMLGVFTAPRFAAAIPRAELVPLPAVGHVPMLDDPELVARAILGFTVHADTPPQPAATRA